MKKKLLSVLTCICLAIGLCGISAQPSAAFASEDVLITEGYRDTTVIPDKYNTGFITNEDTIIASESGGTYCGIKIPVSGGKYALDFRYNNTSIGSEVLIENVDFSALPVKCINYGDDLPERTVIFRNCKFSHYTTQPDELPLTFVFENCTLDCFEGSNATFNQCYLGGTITDAFMPYHDVYVNNCYVSNMSFSDSSGLHSDGMQMRIKDGIENHDIVFSNCRMEIPSLQFSDSSTYVNACLMVCPDTNTVSDVEFADCILNGGGFSIYVTQNTENQLENIVFRNISIGTSHRYGI